ncbi:hypothetical protein VNO77_15454 [Canavalia gladiata]|uniref:Uncharacterized protein n=1 Tax=Canavalia gladiata TaxID=3824 RepID=A0AAN9QR88_CANGL
MAPSSTRTRMKWQKVEERKLQKSMATRPCAAPLTSSSGTKELGIKNNVEDVDIDDNKEDSCSLGCSTPKGKRFRIPEVTTCPPAPKKRRVTITVSSKRSPIPFFASPDIELFFFSALKNVSA